MSRPSAKNAVTARICALYGDFSAISDGYFRPQSPVPCIPPQRRWFDRLCHSLFGSPEAVAVNGNGNGHHDAIGIGPTVELVPVNGNRANGHKAVPVNDNGANGHHDDEALEPE